MNDPSILLILFLIIAVGSFIGAWLIARPASALESLPEGQFGLKGNKRASRYSASVIDNIAALLSFALGGIALANLSETMFPWVPRWIPGFAGFFIYLAYYLVCEALFSTTPGKAFFGLRVLQINGDSAPGGVP